MSGRGHRSKARHKKKKKKGKGGQKPPSKETSPDVKYGAATSEDESSSESGNSTTSSERTHKKKSSEKAKKETPHSDSRGVKSQRIADSGRQSSSVPPRGRGRVDGRGACSQPSKAADQGRTGAPASYRDVLAGSGGSGQGEARADPHAAMSRGGEYERYSYPQYRDDNYEEEQYNERRDMPPPAPWMPHYYYGERRDLPYYDYYRPPPYRPYYGPPTREHYRGPRYRPYTRSYYIPERDIAPPKETVPKGEHERPSRGIDSRGTPRRPRGRGAGYSGPPRGAPSAFRPPEGVHVSQPMETGETEGQPQRTHQVPPKEQTTEKDKKKQKQRPKTDAPPGKSTETSQAKKDPQPKKVKIAKSSDAKPTRPTRLELKDVLTECEEKVGRAKCSSIIGPLRLYVKRSRSLESDKTLPELTPAHGCVSQAPKASIDDMEGSLANSCGGKTFNVHSRLQHVIDTRKLEAKNNGPMLRTLLATSRRDAFVVDTGPASQNMIPVELSRQMQKPDGENVSDTDLAIYETSRNEFGYIEEENFQQVIHGSQDDQTVREAMEGKLKLDEDYVANLKENPQYITPLGVCTEETQSAIRRDNRLMDRTMNFVELTKKNSQGRCVDSYLNENEPNAYYDTISQSAKMLTAKRSLRKLNYVPLPLSQRPGVQLEDPRKNPPSTLHEEDFEEVLEHSGRRFFPVSKISKTDSAQWQQTADATNALIQEVTLKECAEPTAQVTQTLRNAATTCRPMLTRDLARELYSDKLENRTLSHQDAFDTLRYLSVRPVGSCQFTNYVRRLDELDQALDAMRFLGGPLPYVYALSYDYVQPTKEEPEPPSESEYYIRPPKGYEIGKQYVYRVTLMQMHGATQICTYTLLDPDNRKTAPQEQVERLTAILTDPNNIFVHEGPIVDFIRAFDNAYGINLMDPARHALHVSLLTMTVQAGLTLSDGKGVRAPLGLVSLWALLALTDKTSVLYDQEFCALRPGSWDVWRKNSGFNDQNLELDWVLSRQMLIQRERTAMLLDSAILLSILCPESKLKGTETSPLVEEIRAAFDAKYVLSPFKYQITPDGRMNHATLFPEPKDLVKDQMGCLLDQGMQFYLQVFEAKIKNPENELTGLVAPPDNNTFRRRMSLITETSESFIQWAHKSILEQSIAHGQRYNYAMFGLAIQCMHKVSFDATEMCGQDVVTSGISKYMRGIMAANVPNWKEQLKQDPSLRCLTGYDCFDPPVRHCRSTCSCDEYFPDNQAFQVWNCKPRTEKRLLLEQTPLKDTKQLFTAEAFASAGDFLKDTPVRSRLLPVTNRTEFVKQLITDHHDSVLNMFGCYDESKLKSLVTAPISASAENKNALGIYVKDQGMRSVMTRLHDAWQQDVAMENREELTSDLYEEMCKMSVQEPSGSQDLFGLDAAAERKSDDSYEGAEKHMLLGTRLSLVLFKEMAANLDWNAISHVREDLIPDEYRVDDLQYWALAFAVRLAHAVYTGQPKETGDYWATRLWTVLRRLRGKIANRSAWVLFELPLHVQEGVAQEQSERLTAGLEGMTGVCSQDEIRLADRLKECEALRRLQKQQVYAIRVLSRFGDLKNITAAKFYRENVERLNDMANRNELFNALSQAIRAELFHIYVPIRTKDPEKAQMKPTEQARRMKRLEERATLVATPSEMITPDLEDSIPMDHFQPIESETPSVASSTPVTISKLKRVRPRAFDPDSQEYMGPVAKCPSKFTGDLSEEPGERFHQILVNSMPPLTGDIIRSSYRMDDAQANASVIDIMNTSKTMPSFSKNKDTLDNLPDDRAAELIRERERLQKAYDDNGGLHLGALSGLLITAVADRMKANPLGFLDEAMSHGDVFVLRTIMNMANLLTQLGYDEGTCPELDWSRVGLDKPSINFERARRVAITDSCRTRTQELFSTGNFVGDEGNLEYAINEFMMAAPRNPDKDEETVLKDEMTIEPPQIRADWIHSMRQAYRRQGPFQRMSTGAPSRTDSTDANAMETEVTPTVDKVAPGDEAQMESDESL